jgi:hypothetical protein
MSTPTNPLVVEDNPGDACLIREEFHSELQGVVLTLVGRRAIIFERLIIF